MTVEDYEKMLSKIGPELFSASTREELIFPSEKLLLTLKYLFALIVRVFGREYSKIKLHKIAISSLLGSNGRQAHCYDDSF